MGYSPNERKPKPPCDDCTSVLTNFEIDRCPKCTFIKSYEDFSHNKYFVCKNTDGLFGARKQSITGKTYDVAEIQPQYSFAEAQSVLNEYAARKKLRNCWRG